MSERNRKIAEYLKAIALLIESDSVSQTCEQPLVIPEGWRELSPDEVPRLGDMAEQLGAWRARKSVGSKAYELYEVRHIRKIETANPSETPNSLIPDPGPGYRLLSKEPPEPVREGDEFWQKLKGEWVEIAEFVHETRQQAPSYYYRRKIETAETANPSETPNSSTWIPKIGDKVWVSIPGRAVSGLECLVEGKYSEGYVVSSICGFFRSTGIEAKDLQLIEAANPSETPNSWAPDPGEGYRLLSKDPSEQTIKGDDIWVTLSQKWIESDGWKTVGGPQSAGRYYRRKLEPAVPAEWVPKTGDWVKVNKHVGNPGRRKYWNEQMDLYNHKIGCVSAVNVDRGFATIAGFTREGYYHWQFDFDWLEPAEAPADHIADVNKMVNPSEIPNSSAPTEWIPRVGDKVRVIKPDRRVTGLAGVIVEDTKGEYAVRVLNAKLTSYELEAKDLQLIEPSNLPETPDSSKPDPGEGYRLLSKEPPEDLQPGDDFHSKGEWQPSVRANDDIAEQDKCYYRRKIEPAQWIPRVGDKVRVVGVADVTPAVGIVRSLNPNTRWAYFHSVSKDGGYADWFRFEDLELVEAAK